MHSLLTRILVFLILSCGVIHVQAQHSMIDSLQRSLQAHPTMNQEKARLQLKLAEAYWYVNLDTTFALGKALQQWAAQEAATAITARALFVLGVANNMQGDYQEGLEHFTRSLEISRSIPDSQSISAALNSLGITHEILGNYGESIKYYLQALEIREAIGNEKGVAGTLGNISIVYQLNEDHEKALDYAERSLALYRKLGDQVGISNALNMLGVLYKNLHQYEKALEYYQENLKLQEASGNERGKATSYNNIAIVYEKLGQYEQSLEYQMKSLELHRQIGDKEGTASSHHNLGSVYTAMKKFDLAMEQAEMALAITQEVGKRQGVALAYKLISDIHKDAGRHRLALEFLEKSVALNDSLFTEKKAQQIAELETKYETAKKEKQIALSEKEIGLLEKDQTIKAWTIGGLVSGIVLLLVIAGLLFYAQRQNLHAKEAEKARLLAQNKLIEEEQEKLKLEVEYKSKELTNFALHIVQKNEMLEELQQKIDELISSGSHDKEELRQLDRQILQQTDLDKDREIFNMHVEEAHQQFFQNLETHFPDLTEKDRRLSALLRLDFSSKEIAALHNIEPKSVEQSRYRLRKKFNLSKEDNLTAFLKGM